MERQPWSPLFFLLLIPLASACTADLGIEGYKYACQTAADCPAGYLCAVNGCVLAHGPPIGHLGSFSRDAGHYPDIGTVISRFSSLYDHSAGSSVTHSTGAAKDGGYKCRSITGWSVGPTMAGERPDAGNRGDGGDGGNGGDGGSMYVVRTTMLTQLPDGGVSSADAGPDGGVDAGEDAGADAGEDGGADASEDAGADAGDDVGVDSGEEDAGVDAGEDAGDDVSDAGDEQ